MRKIIVTAAALSAIAIATVSGSARADDAAGPHSGLELGLRAGYGVPLGNVTGNTTANGSSDSLSNSISGMIPLQLDALYMINPNIRVGAYFMYGFGFVPSSATGCNANGVSCSVHDIRTGIQAHYHFMPDQTIDPWVGLGVGYEIADASASVNGKSLSGSDSGFEFINIQGGGDYKVMPNLGVGPFVSFSLGQYGNMSGTDVNGTTTSKSIDKTAMHEWLILGIRGDYEIGF